jgi:hypothetical protein
MICICIIAYNDYILLIISVMYGDYIFAEIPEIYFFH